MPATKRKSLCQGKSVAKPNRCKKVRGCKVAKGPKRTFCRKAKNRTRKKTQSSTRRRRASPARSGARRSKGQVISQGKWAGYTKAQMRALKNLGRGPYLMI